MQKGDATYPTMTIDECLAFSDEWSRGVTSQDTGLSNRVLKLFAEMQAISNPEAAAYHAGSQGWRVVCMLLAEEVRAVRQALPDDFSESKDWRFDMAPAPRIEWLKARLRSAKEEAERLEADLAEQCRLLGMGASREARLMARMTRMVDLMRKLREPDWHIESIREFQRELTALENAAMSDDSALREMIEAAKAEEREMCAALVEQRSERSRTVRAALNGTQPEPCEYAAAIRAMKG